MTDSQTATENTPTGTSYFKWFIRFSLVSILIIAIGLFFYLAHLDNKIRTTFKGKRWDIPARVYANPLDLYVGLKINATEFEDLLQQLHYRRDRDLSSGGGFYRHKQQVTLKTRDFRFWDSQQASQHLRVRFDKTTITGIISVAEGKAIPILRMEPVQIGSFYPKRKEDRILIKLKQAPAFLIHGLLATEDRDFYQHYGISVRAVARAIWANIRAGAWVQGGSTITQQLIKNFYLSPERSLKRKVNEAFLALLLEVNYEKDEILEAYLNEIYLGQDGASAVHGFGLASEFYFGRPLKDLKLHQVASLIALVRGPSYYDLRRKPKRAIKRRDLVLDKMLEEGYISAKQVEEAKKQPLKTVARKHRSVNRYPSFLDLVKRQLSKQYRKEDITTEGLSIFTTLDTRVQNTLEQITTIKLKDFETRPRSKNLETAALVTRRESGEIVALIGGRKPSEAGFNRALDAVRQIGSLVKPAIYLAALSQPEKYTLTSWVNDASIQLKTNGGAWKPRNYDNKEHGIIPLHTALTHSYNLATVNLGLKIGVDEVIATLKRLGIKRDIEAFPSLLLGALSLTPFEVTQMYQTFAGDGFLTPLRAIRAVVDKDGTPLKSYPYVVKQTINPAATYLTNTILQQVMRVGTGRSAYKYLPKELALAGKTGTTNQSKDSWFAGYSGDYLGVVWIGRDDNKSAALSGAVGALQVWNRLMRKIAQQKVNLIAPESIEKVWIDPSNGLLASAQCDGVKAYPYIIGSTPTKFSPCIKAKTTIKNPPVKKESAWFGDFFDETKTHPEPAPKKKKESDDSWFDDFFAD